MQYLVNAAQMKSADQYTIQKLGVPSLELMERAADGCIQIMEQEKMDFSDVCVVCGTGNNGGDGFAIARMLLEKDYKVQAFLVGDAEHCTKETKEQIRKLEACGGKVRYCIPEDGHYSLVIDAVFGVGLSRDVDGIYRQVIEWMNAQDAVRFAVDIPSGLSATTGCVLGCAFEADYTVTFQFKKLGLELAQGRKYAGKTVVWDIGISAQPLMDDTDIVKSDEKEDYRKLLPKREEDSNKGSYGKLLIIAGSKGMAGAAYLNAHAAYMAGAGLVRIYTAKDNRAILQTLLPEAIITTYEDFEQVEVIRLLEWADAVCVGSGLGQSKTAERILKTVIDYVRVPCLIDADGLNLLADNKNYLRHIEGRRFVITPHMKEMSRVTGDSVENLKKDRVEFLKQFVETLRIVCVLKDSRTLIAGEERGIRLNQTGNCAMAKAGSGDVLAGIIAGFMAQGKELEEAASLGTYVHGLSGDLAKIEKGVYSVMARDLIEYISKALMELEE
nr:NAD(P)H-hydrate dehydratase [uncultured Dorea sp.]